MGNPQSNGQVEVTNRIIVKHLKTRLLGRQGDWADDLPAVLWAYRTTPRSATEEAPFNLVYGSEAVVPTEFIRQTARVITFDQNTNNEARVFDLNTLEERRRTAYLRLQRYQAAVAKVYNKKVRPKNFQLGDWVLKKVEVSKHVGKLDPNWEGPYKIVKVSKNNAYRLEDTTGNELPRPWNALNLRRFYV